MEKEKEVERAKEAAKRAREAFLKEDYAEAIKHYTEAISYNDKNHLLYSNRSACYANIEQYQAALEDAKKCLALKPDFARGYERQGLAEYYLEKYEEAIQSYTKGLELEPSNEQLKDGLSKAQQAYNSNLFGTEAEIMQKLMADRTTQDYFNDPDFVAKFNLTRGNLQMLFSLMKTDPRFVRVFNVLSGIPISEVMKANEARRDSAAELRRKEEEEAHFKAAQAKDQAAKDAQAKMSAAEAKLHQDKLLAEEEKARGNEAYKAKNFEKALGHYDRACELDPREPVYSLNKASVFMEQRRFNECLTACDKAIELAQQLSPRPLEKLARAFGRKGNCYVQMEKFAEALEAYDASLLEVNEPTIRDARKKCLELKKNADEKAYMDPVKAEEHKQRGNEFFRDGNYTAAIKEYDEAIKRAPYNASFFVNRALAFMKLVEYPKALEDVDRALHLDPNYVKAYAKKGHIHFFLKEYHKSITAYEKGLKIEPTNTECLEGKQRAQQTAFSTPPDEQRAAKAMDDPEIRALMQDPRIRQFMKEIRESPQGMRSTSTMADPFLQEAVPKLIAAGILGMK